MTPDISYVYKQIYIFIKFNTKSWCVFLNFNWIPPARNTQKPKYRCYYVYIYIFVFL